MASQVVLNISSSSLEVVEIHSYVRGSHGCMDKWEDPEQCQYLLLKRQLVNNKDRHAAAVLKEEEIVGHIPYSLAPAVYQFLRRDVNIRICWSHWR